MADNKKPFDATKPDLEELGNVAEMHDEMLRKNAAASREKTLRENGTEPVAIWVFLICGIALVIGGAVLGSRGTFLDYDERIVDGYVQTSPPDALPEVVKTGTALAVYSKIGQTIYSSKCGGCHQANGQGAAGSYPPLNGSEWVTGNSGLAAAIILHGLQGPITVKGTPWNGNMPPQGLTDPTEVGAVLTYIRNSFGNATGDVITAEMGQAALDAYKAHGPTQVTAEVLREKFDKALEGATIDPQTVISIETLEPVEEAASE